MEFQDEIKNFIKVWTLAIVSLSYCYYIPSKLPIGISRLISILPIISLFFFLPLNVSYINLCGPTAFFLTWLANSKLILFAFDQGPLSPPHSLFQFISMACLPIKIKQDSETKNSKFENGRNPRSILLAIKFVLLLLVLQSYSYKQFLPKYVIHGRYCIHVYLQLEIVLALCAIPARAILGFVLEPQFNEPYLTTSLQDFWGRRWNLMVPTMLRPTVYIPVRRVSTTFVGREWAPLPAVVSSFLVSGLFHELIFYYFTRVAPTWEVTWFFVLQGVCTAVEIAVKRAVGDKWRLHRGVSGPLTVAFVAAMGVWLFFPQVLKNGDAGPGRGSLAMKVLKLDKRNFGFPTKTWQKMDRNLGPIERVIVGAREIGIG